MRNKAFIIIDLRRRLTLSKVGRSGPLDLLLPGTQPAMSLVCDTRDETIANPNFNVTVLGSSR